MSGTRPIERKLTTVLAADAANYSGQMSRDEEGTVQALRATRIVIDQSIAACGGRIANTSGDGLIADFPSVVGAVRCAVDIQRTLNTQAGLLPFRLGVHLGDVIVEGQDLLGDGVNLAARLQEMADIGGILISQHVYDHTRGKLGTVELRPLGPKTPKHLAEDVAVYAVVAEGVTPPKHLNQLGPKVTRAVPAEQNTPTDPARQSFQKDRNRLLGIMGGLIVLEIALDLPFWLTGVPTLWLLFILYRKWRAFKDVETTG